MFEAKRRGMQCEAGRFAPVRQRLAVNRAIIDALSAQRGTSFSEVNADLVGSACFEPAFDQGVFAEPFNHMNVGDRQLTL